MRYLCLPARRASRRIAPLALLLAAGCIRDLGPGPDLGACADYPDGIYTYGEIGIGTCLSGPADLQVFDRDGRTWIGVLNADPFLVFGEGSLLLIDFDSIDLDKRENRLDELEAYALPMDLYVGGLGLVPDRDLAIVTSRFSEDALTRDASDKVFVVDLSDPTAPSLWSEGGSITVEDDPQPIVVDEEAGFAYVVNLTDHSVSVIDTTSTPLAVIDLHPSAILGDVEPFDADDSGSRMNAVLTRVDTEDVSTDVWTMSWIDGAYRVWVAQDGGLARWSSGGDSTYIASALGVEIDPADSADVEEIVDPLFLLSDSLPSLLFADRGAIRIVQALEGFDGGLPVGGWTWETQEAILGGSDEGWDYWLEGPCPAVIDGDASLYYTGRADDSEPGAIGVARVIEGSAYARELEPVLAPPTGSSYEQPFVVTDPFTGQYRMWFSVWDGARWSVAVSESADGLAWSEPVTALTDKTADIAAPVLAYTAGRYRMWFSHRTDGGTWATATAWSWDGVTWFDVTDVLPGDPALADAPPPRPALQADVTSGWRLEGVDTGLASFTIVSGGEFVTDDGFSLHSSVGFEVSPTEALEDAVAVVPDSAAMVGGEHTLYATVTDADGVASLVALQPDGQGGWAPAATDLIPQGEGGNAAGAQSGVIYGTDGDWTLVYAATGNDGTAAMYRATSTDGLSFSPVSGRLLQPEAWDALAQLPHSVQDLGGGSVRLWFAGDSGSLLRIGSALSTDGGQSFTREPAALNEWQLGTGTPGDFDDSGVRDPLVYEEGGVTHMLYSGFDGEGWRIGHASRTDDTAPWTREYDPYTETATSSMSGVGLTFSTRGVRSPVAFPGDDAVTDLWYAGEDGFQVSLGQASRIGTHLFPHQRFPTLGDEQTFFTEFGGTAEQVIELAQQVEAFSTSGVGVVSATLDPERGFLYVTSKLTNYIYVLDVRDDSTADFDDRNYLDIEALLLITSITGSVGFRDVIPVPGTDLLYAAGRLPDALLALDISELEDNDVKEVVTTAPVAAIETRTSEEDVGADNLAEIGLADLILAADGHTLLAPHFNENSLYAYDLDVGPYGEEVGLLRNIGENPHAVRLTPNGRYAVVANYLGEVEDLVVGSNLAVVDVDPASDTYLEVLTWLVNQ